MNESKVGGTIRDLQLECAMVLHQTLLDPVIIYSSETLVWKEKQLYRWKASEVC